MPTFIEVTAENTPATKNGSFKQVCYLHRDGKHPERFEQWAPMVGQGNQRAPQPYTPGRYLIDMDALYVAQHINEGNNGRKFVEFRLAIGGLKPIASVQSTQRAA
jgi:hypothetical protein